MRILIADDHAVVRRGLREILADTFPSAQFGEASNSDEVMSYLTAASYCMLLLDINMPGRSGLDALREIKRDYPRLPVVVLSVQPEDQYAMRCLRAGAAAYINKNSVPEELAQAAKKILDGGHYVTAVVAEKLVASLAEPADKPLHELLSDRELEVMRMIASGTSLKNISNLLHLSAKTVSSYRARIMEKMRLANNAELTRYALMHRLID